MKFFNPRWWFDKLLTILILMPRQTFALSSIYTTNSNITELEAYKNRINLDFGPCANLSLYEICDEVEGCYAENVGSKFYPDITRFLSIGYNGFMFLKTSDHSSLYIRNHKNFDQVIAIFKDRNILVKESNYIKIVKDKSSDAKSLQIFQGLSLKAFETLYFYEMLDGYQILLVYGNNKSNDIKDLIHRYGDRYLIVISNDIKEIKGFFNTKHDTRKFTTNENYGYLSRRVIFQRGNKMKDVRLSTYMMNEFFKKYKKANYIGTLYAAENSGIIELAPGISSDFQDRADHMIDSRLYTPNPFLSDSSMQNYKSRYDVNKTM